MKTFYHYFTGHYPVGAVALVQAANKFTGARRLAEKYAEIGLPQEVDPNELVPVELDREALVLLDGNY